MKIKSRLKYTEGSLKRIAALALMASSAALWAAEPQPNVILILADDLGYGDVGVYGCEDIRTPNIDRLAESGVRLTDGYVSHPYCGPSRAGLMTGRYQQRFGVRCNPAHQPMNTSLGVDVEEETLGDIFTRAGYHTATVGKWHLGAAEHFHPNNRGFDLFFGFLSGGRNFFPRDYEKMTRSWLNRENPPVPELYGYGEPLQINGIPLPPPDGYLTDILTTQAIGFIRQNKQDPFFIYLAYNAPHEPLQAPEETIAKYAGIADKDRRVYAAMVDNMDMNIGRVVDELEKLRIRDNTLIVFLSDNGGHTGHGANNGPLAGGKANVQEGGVRVPFIWNWPAGLPQGRTSDAVISSLDLLPTFAALAGVEPQGRPLDGVNVLSRLKGDTDGSPHEQLCWLSNEFKQGIRLGNFKALREKGNPWRLYDLSSDIGESKDLSAAMPEKTAALAEAYAKWLSEMPKARFLDPGAKSWPGSLLSGDEMLERFNQKAAKH